MRNVTGKSHGFHEIHKNSQFCVCSFCVCNGSALSESQLIVSHCILLNLLRWIEEEFDGRKVDLRVYQGPFASRQMGRVIEDRLNAVSLHILLLDSLVRIHLCVCGYARTNVCDPVTHYIHRCYQCIWKELVLFRIEGSLHSIGSIDERRSRLDVASDVLFPDCRSLLLVFVAHIRLHVIM